VCKLYFLAVQPLCGKGPHPLWTVSWAARGTIRVLVYQTAKFLCMDRINKFYVTCVTQRNVRDKKDKKYCVIFIVYT